MVALSEMLGVLALCLTVNHILADMWIGMLIRVGSIPPVLAIQDLLG